MDILIESTKDFEIDLSELNEGERAEAIQKINDCADLFLTQKGEVYRKLRRLPLLSSTLNGYESSLYTLRVSKRLSMILTVDEDPIFRQVIFTLFRAVKHDDLDKAYQGIAESLYQEFLHRNRETVQIS
jgi:hypothetical protein